MTSAAAASLLHVYDDVDIIAPPFFPDFLWLDLPPTIAVKMMMMMVMVLLLLLLMVVVMVIVVVLLLLMVVLLLLLMVVGGGGDGDGDGGGGVLPHTPQCICKLPLCQSVCCKRAVNDQAARR